MAAASPAIYRVFGEEIDRLRAILRDLDPADVPAALRRVVAYAGGRRLPPPFLKSLLVEIDRNDWLRDRLLEEAGDDASDALAAFLEHEPGWWLALVDAAGIAAPADDDVEGELAALRRRLEEARRRHGELRAALESAEVALRKSRAVVRRDEELKEARGEIARLERDVADARRARKEALSAAAAADERVASILHRERKRTAGPSPASATIRGGGMTDPVETARRLDRAVAGFAASVASGIDSALDGDAVRFTLELDPVALPAGLAPDSTDAIEWLLTDAPDVPVIVDGYNITYLLDSASFTAADTRHRLVSELERFSRRSRPEHRVSVFFDSSMEGSSAGRMSPGGVEVVFATTSDSADDAIVEEVAALGGRAVVITNDRELQDRCGAVGATVLWGSALSGWIGG